MDLRLLARTFLSRDRQGAKRIAKSPWQATRSVTARNTPFRSLLFHVLRFVRRQRVAFFSYPHI